MSVQAPPKPSAYDDFDEDEEEGPAIFKRTNAVSKQSQSNSEVKIQLPQKPDGHSGRQVSGGSSNNGVSSVTQNAKVIQSNKSPPVRSPLASPRASTSSTKPPPVKSPLVSPKASTSSTKPPPVKSPLVSPKASTSSTKTPTMKSPLVIPKASNSSTKPPLQKSSASVSKASASLDWRSKYLSDNGKCSIDKNKKSSVGNSSKSGSRSDDSDDDDPSSARVKVNPNQNTKAFGKPATSLKVQPPKKNIVKEENSDDEPLSSRFQIKSNAGSSGSKHSDFEDKKPLSLSSKQNGSIKADERKLLNTGSKRPLDKQISDGSSMKKQKISDSLSAGKSTQVKVKAEIKDESDDDNIPISQRMKKSPTPNTKSPTAKPKVMKTSVKTTTKFKKTDKNSKYSKSTKVSPSSGDGQKKWTTLVHNGVIFPPEYSPHGVKMLYNGKPVDLTPAQEEVATMFAVMQDSEYVQKKTFRDNFWNDWRKILGRNHVIQKLDACDFTPIYDWYQIEKEKKKLMNSEEKKAVKEEKLKQEEKYMWAILDGVKEKVGNFRVEPPGLFRGRGEHPKSGKLKSRIYPKDVTINIGKGAPIPECPIPGQSWKEIRHDNTVTWLAFWLDPISKREFKYVFLAASSSLKGQSDKEKYEKARKLKGYIHNIRAAYTRDFNSRDSTKRQIAVATYLIDKLALRAGNEKDDDEADTVGCCTLKVENVKPIPPNKLEFNFLGKDSIKYENTVEVELPVYKAIIQFQSGGKKGTDDLFDDLDTSKLNTHLKELMPGLTAKVFRTYNASITLDEMLNRETRDGTVEEKKTVYNAANKEVAIICNHQRMVSKSHESQMLKLTEKLQELEDLVKDLKVDLARAKKGKPPLKDADGKQKRNLSSEAIEKKIGQTNMKIEKIKRDMHAKEDVKTIALGTSKLNYLDPRITVAWCKRHEVPIEKIFAKTLMSKFCWAMDVDPDFRF